MKQNQNTLTDLRKLSDELLDQNLMSFIKKEKEVFREILLHIAEVDRRRLFLRMGYSSLYVYLTERMGYDGGSAQRRLDAARLAQQVPSVIDSIDQGEITLAQVTFLQKSLRQNKQQQISAEAKAEIVETMKHKTFAETQVAVCKSLDIALKEAPKIRHQANESVRFEVTLTKDQWAKIQTMRELLSTTLPNGEWDQVLEYIAGKVIAQKTKAPKSPQPSKTPQASNSSKLRQSQNSQHETSANRPSPVSEALKRQVLLRDKCCQYKSAKTGKMCGSKWNLQVDHIKPLWAQGTNELSNLRALCANHNQEVYWQQAGIRRS